MDNHIPDTIAGVSTWAALAAYFGSALSLSFMPKLSPVQTWVTVLTGGAVATAGFTLLHSWKPEWPQPAIVSCAFFLGLFAMPMMPTILEKLRKLIGNAELPTPKG